MFSFNFSILPPSDFFSSTSLTSDLETHTHTHKRKILDKFCNHKLFQLDFKYWLEWRKIFFILREKSLLNTNAQTSLTSLIIKTTFLMHPLSFFNKKSFFFEWHFHLSYPLIVILVLTELTDNTVKQHLLKVKRKHWKHLPPSQHFCSVRRLFTLHQNGRHQRCERKRK